MKEKKTKDDNNSYQGRMSYEDSRNTVITDLFYPSLRTNKRLCITYKDHTFLLTGILTVVPNRDVTQTTSPTPGGEASRTIRETGRFSCYQVRPTKLTTGLFKLHVRGYTYGS